MSRRVTDGEALEQMKAPNLRKLDKRQEKRFYCTMKQRRIVPVVGSIIINVWQWREITNLSSPLSPSEEGPVEVNQELSSVLVG